MLLTDLAQAARKSGLRVIELEGWRGNYSAGLFNPDGVLCHHTGSYDSITDAQDDLSYAKWMAFQGRSDLDPPLCNLALSAECVVYVCSSGNANHAGEARATGPMPFARDGNALYIGIEAMNSGSQGWGSKGLDAQGNEITQREAYARLCAALCLHYGWDASHVRAHRETSSTGKWDPGLLDMEAFRAEVARWIKLLSTQEDYMATPEAAKKLDQILNQVKATRKLVKGVADQVENIADTVAGLPEATEDVKKRITKSKRELKALIAELDQEA